MAVARILHVIHLDAIENSSSVLDNLVALFESGWLALDVTTTYQEKLIGGSLHIGEVVLEVEGNVDCAAEHLLFNQVVLENGL